MTTPTHRYPKKPDIINYLQENQALLKTILRKTQLNSANPGLETLQDREFYTETLAEIKASFESATAIAMEE